MNFRRQPTAGALDSLGTGFFPRTRTVLVDADVRAVKDELLQVRLHEQEVVPAVAPDRPACPQAVPLDAFPLVVAQKGGPNTASSPQIGNCPTPGEDCKFFLIVNTPYESDNS